MLLYVISMRIEHIKPQILGWFRYSSKFIMWDKIFMQKLIFSVMSGIIPGYSHDLREASQQVFKELWDAGGH